MSFRVRLALAGSARESCPRTKAASRATRSTRGRLAEPGQPVDTLVVEARALVARQFGILGSVCFDALLHPDREAERGGLECFESLVHIQRLESLPMPPKERLS